MIVIEFFVVGCGVFGDVVIVEIEEIVWFEWCFVELVCIVREEV